MKLISLKNCTLKSTYVENLERWIDIPIWPQEELLTALSGLDYRNMNLEEYKQITVTHLTTLDSPDPATTEEVYAILLKENPVLHPNNLSSNSQQDVNMSDEFTYKIKLAFLAKDKSAIQVLDGGL